MQISKPSPWLRRLAVLGVLAALFAGTQAALAAPQDKDAPGEGDDGDEDELGRLDAEIMEHFSNKEYAEAAEKCRQQMKLAPKHSNPPYNLACALARLGKKEDALAALAKAVELGFDDADHLKADEDLASLRDEKAFADVLARCAEVQKASWEKLYDAGPDVSELKSVDGAPEGGLRYRLLMSKDASAEKPQRLLVWLHPSGGSMNKSICELAPRWSKAGWAVLVPTQKKWNGWSKDEAAKLVEQTLPAVAKTPGVDAKRPLLVGFSAGGQKAIELWSKDAAMWGGLVLDAAYPFDVDAYLESRAIVVIAPPKGDAAKSAPVCVIVGDADEGHSYWKAVEGPWKDAGIPLTVRYVAEGRHEWLVKGAEADALDAWLADVAAGKLPGKDAPKSRDPAEAPK